jgi:hypothetical protein
MKEMARPSDMFLFHAKGEEYIEQSTSQTIASWISSHREAITNSVKKWAVPAQSGSTGIVGWMRGEENNDAMNRLHARQRQDILNEEQTQKETRKEERRRRRARKSTNRQTTIAQFFGIHRSGG